MILIRIWHYKIVPFLPRTQLLSAWRELNSIYKKQDNHILINYIYNYDKSYLYEYSILVESEMKSRGYKINKYDNYNSYFQDYIATHKMGSNIGHYFSEHDNEYLTICYYNLKEKYTRGQKDFTKEMWDKIEKAFG